MQFNREQQVAARPRPSLQLNTTDEIQDILGHPPGWMLRWGISLVMLVVLIGLVIAWLIKYPDIIEAPVRLTSQHPPIEVVSQQSGKLQRLLVVDQEMVEQGALLAVLDNTAAYEDILALEQSLGQLEKSQGADYLRLRIPNTWQLGLLNTDFVEWRQKVQAHQYFLKQHTLAQRIGAMEREIVQIEDLKSSLDKQAALYEQELSLAQKNYERQSKLHRERLVSDTELEELEGALIQSKRQLEALRSGIINHQLRIEQLQAEMTVLRADRSDELADQQMEVQQWTDRLLAALQQWKHQYLIHAPIAGKINFDQIRSSQQFIEQGKVVFTIIPEQEQGKIIAQCLVPLRGVGKIDNGCRANIRLDAYPHREFGVIASKIEKIALIPKENEDGESNYQMEMHLPDQLITSYEKTIPFRQGMTGRVHVITEDRRVVERIFDRILSIVKNG